MSRELLEPAAVSALERQLLVTGSGGSSGSKPNIQPVGTSALLSQLKQFLPKMQQANAELQQRLQECDPTEVDIEHLPEQQGKGTVIQMDLACGLLELRDSAALAAAQRTIAAGGEVQVEMYDGGTSDSDDSDDTDDSDGSEECDGVDNEDDGSGGCAMMTACTRSQQGEGACSPSAAAAGAAAVAGAAADGADTMDYDGSYALLAAAAAAAETASAAANTSEVARQQRQQGGQQLRHQQQQQRRRRQCKAKSKQPKIVELS